jgi:DNA replication and repair protein RecF
MICERIKLENFRNAKHADLCFSDGVNILVGDNGEGKTNLVEAIGFASVGKSFRGADDGEMINFDENEALISVDFKDSIRHQNIMLRMYREKPRQVELNKVKIRRMSDMVGNLSTVIFCPEHLSIIKDGPSMRRNYLDVAISQLRPVYIASLSRYNQILRQRNKLIRDAVTDRRTFDETIDFWSEQLASEAAVISSFRAGYLKRASVHVAEFFKDMTRGNEVPELKYCGSSRDDEAFYSDRNAVKKKYIELLKSSHEREICAGTTLWGVHKDDIEVTLNGRPARIYASQGQQRSLALSLKLTEGEICREERGEYPVFLLDDVLSELDAGRRTYLISEIKNRQVIMTTCEPFECRGAEVIRVKKGEYEKVKTGG